MSKIKFKKQNAKNIANTKTRKVIYSSYKKKINYIFKYYIKNYPHKDTIFKRKIYMKAKSNLRLKLNQLVSSIKSRFPQIYLQQKVKLKA